MQSRDFEIDRLPAVCTPDIARACGEYNDPVPQVPYLKGWTGKP